MNSENYWKNSKKGLRSNNFCQSAGTRKITILVLALPLVLAGFLFVDVYMSHASEPVVINEIMWMGSSVSTADEWIELRNFSSSFIDFSSTPWSIYRNDVLMVVIDKGILEANGYFLVSNNKKDYFFTGGESILNIDPDYIDTSISLYNSAVQYKLYDAADNSGKLIDTTDDGSGAPLAGDNGAIKKSMERKDDCADSKSSSCWQTCFKAVNLDEGVIDCATPRAKNSEEIVIPPPPPPVYSKKLIINELLPDPTLSPEKDFEFIEIYNNDDKEIDLDGWKIKDKTGSFSLSGIVESSSYVFFYDTVSLNNDGDEITLMDPNGEIVSEVEYGKAEENFSYARKDEKWKWTSWLTPGAKNIFDEDISYPEGVYINEILPDPKGDEEKKEYIELFNSNEKDVDLFKWILKDSGKTSKYVFPEKTKIKSEEYLLVKRSDFDFALNNSGEEELSLLNPAGKAVSQIKYDGSDENVSYNFFNGKIWRWSPYLTPGEHNLFNHLPQVKVEKDDNIYEDIYAEFRAEVTDPDKDEIKITWDFGDDHKSYLKETRHKYEKTGKYEVTLKVTDGSEDVSREFKIEVKKFPELEVDITALCPNPIGSDSENEWLTISNDSNEDINLKGWSIATGWDNLYNHPIYEDLEIGEGEMKIISRKDCAFTLHNERSQIELRYPNGKVAYGVVYERPDSAAEDEVYQITEKGWVWIAPISDESLDNNTPEVLGEVITSVDPSRDLEFLSGQSFAERKNYRLLLLKFILNQELAEILTQDNGKVLGVSVIKESGNRYVFAEGSNSQDHYAKKFIEKMIANINSRINRLMY